MARRTKAEAEATREAILLAAEEEFLERGVACTTLEHIATRANVTRGAVYWHFKNKVDLFNAMMEKVRLPLERLSGRLAAAPEDPADPAERLHAAVVRILVSLKEDERYRRAYIIWFHRMEATSEFALAVNERGARTAEVTAGFCRLFETVAERGQLVPGVTPPVAAITVRLFLVGMFTEWLRDMSQFDVVEDGTRAFEALLRGLVRCPTDQGRA